MIGEFGNVEVQAFTGLAVRFVREAGARIMIRGLRTLSDMEYEFTMSLMNLNLDPEIETVFLMAKEEFSHVSSSLLRQIAALGGDLAKFLPDPVRSSARSLRPVPKSSTIAPTCVLRLLADQLAVGCPARHAGVPLMSKSDDLPVVVAGDCRIRRLSRVRSHRRGSD